MKIVQNIFDVVRQKKRITFERNENYTKFDIRLLFYKYNVLSTISRTKKKVRNRQPIKIALLMQYSSSTQFLPIFDMMLKDKMFDPYIIVNLDISRDIVFTRRKYAECYRFLATKYPVNRVLSSYDPFNNQIYDLIQSFDLILDSNPYDAMAHDYYKIIRISCLGKPVLMSEYGYSGRTKYESNIYNMRSEKFIWRHYTENQFTKEYMQKFGINKNKIVVSGYSKMDPLSKYSSVSFNKPIKSIIISPHHTCLPNNYLYLGSFLSYSDLLLKLPNIFSDMHFIFRPHPLLINILYDFWGYDKTENYYNKLTSIKNVEYQSGGDYLETFAESDALLHDCGSFLAEYMYTDKPQCYTFASQNDYALKVKQFLPLGLQMLDEIYKSFSHADIIKFVEMVKDGIDPMKQTRVQYAKANIRINYPHATNFMFNDIKKLYTL